MKANAIRQEKEITVREKEYLQFLYQQRTTEFTQWKKREKEKHIQQMENMT